MSGSLWLPVATAPSTSIAIELAALLPPNAELDLPYPVDVLHPRARANLAAVSRALERVLPGICHPTFPSLYGSSVHADATVPVAVKETSDVTDSLTVVEGLRNVSRGGYDPTLPLKKNAGNMRPDELKRRTSDKSCEIASRASPQGENPADFAHAASLRQWAVSASHTPVPSSSIVALISAQEPLPIIAVTFKDLSIDAVSALLTALSSTCGVRFANALSSTVVLPRIIALSAPAPRDFMNAVLTLAESHWRAVLPVYDLLGEESGNVPLSSPAAEVLVRIATSLNAQGAVEALLVCCNGTWREEGVRVVDALLARCKTEPQITAVLVAGLERNVHGLEGSLRFGKLLLTLVKEVPGIVSKHSDILKVVASKSTVFLAKRALAILNRD